MVCTTQQVIIALNVQLTDAHYVQLTVLMMDT